MTPYFASTAAYPSGGMGLFDAFRTRPDELLAAIQREYGLTRTEGPWQWRGRAHGRTLGARHPAGRAGRLELALLPETAEESTALFQFFRLPPAPLAAMPRLEDPDWRERLEDAGGVQVGAGFVLDWDLDVGSPFVSTYSTALLGYLERFSDATEAIVVELPWIIVRLDRAKADPSKAKRDLECADAFLRFFEERRFVDGKDLWS
jgi:hypothetical protein